MARFLYCPRCGAAYHVKDFVRSGDDLLCRTCRFRAAKLCVASLKLEWPRMVVAAQWLTGEYGLFTRLEMADHLGVTKSPALRLAVDTLTDMPAFQRVWKKHPQNGCLTHYYGRK